MLQQADDDATLTQLVIAWVHLAQGGKRYQEASYIFDELIDKFQVRFYKKNITGMRIPVICTIPHLGSTRVNRRQKYRESLPSGERICFSSCD